MNSIWKILANKWVVWSVVILAAVGGYYWYSSSKNGAVTPKYSFATVQKGTIVASISGSGQVAGYRQLDVKPKASGQITKVLVKVGDTVKAGTPLVEIDRTTAVKALRDAERAVEDAKISLQSAQLSLKKSRQPSDAASLLQAQNALAKAQRDYDTLKAGPTDYELKQAQADVDSAQKNIKLSSDGTMPQVVRDAYDQYVTVLQSAQQTLEKSLTDADSVLGLDKAMVKDSLKRMYSIMNSDAKNQSIQSFNKSKISITASGSLVDSLKSSNEAVDNINKASDAVSSALADANDLLNSVSDGLEATLTNSDLSQSEINGYKSSIDSDLTNVNSKNTAILNQIQAVRQAQDNYESAKINYSKVVNSLEKLKQGPTADELATSLEGVKQAQAQLDKLKAGADPIDIQISENSVAQRQSALVSAQNKLKDASDALNDYTVFAPFDGVVGTVQAQESGDASAGSAVVTLLTTQQVATISLNEVDAAKIKEGQKATLTFDAVDSLTLTGEVAEVSPLGTVTQGVVNYTITIAFDTQDERIKSGMSVSTAIVTQVDADVLTVPNSAVKTQGEEHYVETLDIATSTVLDANGYYQTNDTPKRITVQIGLANDSETEITEGLTEGQRVISQTIKTTTAAKTASTSARSGTSLLNMGGPGR
ncbi:MAG: HlyD family efflux transporter periplasmic adaptor subunit [Patescibacteria group bacterium]